jgi:hypothetical protein
MRIGAGRYTQRFVQNAFDLFAIQDTQLLSRVDPIPPLFDGNFELRKNAASITY